MTRIAIIGGGPAGLYFAALAQQLDPTREITVWERNAPDDTFGFGVVFSDETLDGIAGADPAVFAGMEAEFARWSDIDIHYRGSVQTSGGTASPPSPANGCCRSCNGAAPNSASTCAFVPRPRPPTSCRARTTW